MQRALGGAWSPRQSAIGHHAILLALGAGALLLALLAARHLAGTLVEFSEEAGALTLVLVAAAVALLFPVLEPSASFEAMAPLVALVGCDGSGKSTLSADLLAEFGREQRVQGCYLGLGSGALGERIKELPLIGPAFEQRLARKAQQTRTTGEKIPGLATALVVYLFSLARLRRFKRMLRLRRAGVAVITDRYPQIEVPGFYDGPGLSAAQPESRLVALLAREERRLYAWMASFEPSVVIRLNIDADTAHARKPDHRYELLARKVSVTPSLRFNGAAIVDVDSRASYETVRATAASVARSAMAPRLAA